MRKYIYKFKNYTSVEVDNLHDLKEGDLALYEDKFVTRNNGKVEEVVKGSGSSGSSSEDEYSTDYPDNFYFEWIGDSSMKKTQSFKSFNNTSAALFPKETSNETLPGNGKATIVHIHIENLNPKSVKCIFTLPEADERVPSGYVSAYPLSKSFPKAVFLTNKPVSHNYTMGSDSDLLLVSGLWNSSGPAKYSFMQLYFETKDGKKYKTSGIVPLNFSLYSRDLPIYSEDNSKEFLTLSPTLDLL